MNDLDERIRRYVAYLCRLVQEGAENRAALADLRSGLGLTPGEASRMHRHVVPYLDDRDRPSDHWFYVIGALFAYHPEHVPGESIGARFGRLRRADGISESAEARLVALLRSHPDDLPDRLRQAIGVLRAQQMPVDYTRLLRDLVYWDAPDRPVQLNWARDFYRTQTAPAPA